MPPDLIQRLAALPDIEFGDGVSEEAIRAAERVIGSLPVDYRDFLRIFGWASLGSWDVNGLGEDVPPYLNVVDVTLSERADLMPALPSYLVAVHNDGAGNNACTNTDEARDTGESAIYLWNHEALEHQIPAKHSEHFASLIETLMNLHEASLKRD